MYEGRADIIVPSPPLGISDTEQFDDFSADDELKGVDSRG